MNVQVQGKPDERQVLAKAVINAGKGLGLTRDDIGLVIGRDRTAFSRGIDPQSKSGELSLLLIRCYRSLFALVGGVKADMLHWMRTPNHHTHGTPVEQIKTVPGLMQVVQYLDAIRGKV